MSKTSPGYRDKALVETTLTALSWNIWWRFGPWEERFPGIVQTIRECAPDVVGLQEVWDDGSTCQASLLAEELGYSYAYTGASEIAGVLFGNAILSRWPIVRWDSYLLTSVPSDDGSRNCRLVHARVEGPRGQLDVFSTHLSYLPFESGVRQLQVRDISRLVASVQSELPPILMGDFNAVPESDEIRLLTGLMEPPVPNQVFYDAWQVANAPDPGFTWHRSNIYTAAALEPDRRLDYIFVGRPTATGVGHVRSCRMVGTEAVGGVFPSDHYGVAAEILY
ncbi:MAG: endonuclease/exonuclease/phosphatase family protein [Vulcanimicrobiota bacterium]